MAGISRSKGIFVRALQLSVVFLTLVGGETAAWADEPLQQVTLTVERMACPVCERTVASVLEGLAGVISAKADRRSRTAVVTFDPARVTPEQMVQTINTKTFYRASVPTSGAVVSSSAEASASPSSQDAGFASAMLLGIGVLTILSGASFVLWRRRPKRMSIAEGELEPR